MASHGSGRIDGSGTQALFPAHNFQQHSASSTMQALPECDEALLACAARLWQYANNLLPCALMATLGSEGGDNNSDDDDGDDARLNDSGTPFDEADALLVTYAARCMYGDLVQPETVVALVHRFLMAQCAVPVGPEALLEPPQPRNLRLYGRVVAARLAVLGRAWNAMLASAASLGAGAPSAPVLAASDAVDVVQSEPLATGQLYVADHPARMHVARPLAYVQALLARPGELRTLANGSLTQLHLVTASAAVQQPSQPPPAWPVCGRHATPAPQVAPAHQATKTPKAASPAEPLPPRLVALCRTVDLDTWDQWATHPAAVEVQQAP
jgi:hypothetical protein